MADMHPDGYYALVLTAESRGRLRSLYATLPKPIAHHCTVIYGTKDPADLPAAFSPNDLGREFSLKVIGTKGDMGVQAVVVALLAADGSPVTKPFSKNAIPHITVATDGISEAFVSNALLAKGYDVVDGPSVIATLVHTYETGEEDQIQPG